jgi:hypothetical protein
MILATACKKVLKELSLPDVIINEITDYCIWKSTSKTAMWYIIASNLDATCLDRAKTTDRANKYLVNDDEEDMLYIFHKKNDSLALVDHITKFTI